MEGKNKRDRGKWEIPREMEKCSGVRMMALAVVHIGVSVGGVGCVGDSRSRARTISSDLSGTLHGFVYSPLWTLTIYVLHVHTYTYIFSYIRGICIGHRRVSTHKSVDVVNLEPSCSSLRLLFGTIVSIFFFAFYSFPSMHRLQLLYLSISWTKKEGK